MRIGELSFGFWVDKQASLVESLLSRSINISALETESVCPGLLCIVPGYNNALSRYLGNIALRRPRGKGHLVKSTGRDSCTDIHPLTYRYIR